MRHLLLMAVIAVAAGAVTPLGVEAQPAGAAVVTALEGTATVLRKEVRDVAPLAPQATVLPGDTVKTAAGARLRLTFRDGTAVSLGPESTFRVTEAASGASRPSIAVQLTSGAMRFVTQALPDSSYTVRTRVAVAAVRGTDVLVRITEGCEFYVVKGRVAVSHEGSAAPGEVVLTEGLGTEVRSGRPPVAASPWASDRVERLVRDTTVK
jgi:hypothetical protein